jgi:hypothetical protein
MNMILTIGMLMAIYNNIGMTIVKYGSNTILLVIMLGDGMV